MNVKIARLKKKLTQQQVCEAVRISRSILSRIENGDDMKASKELMLKLAAVLDTDVQTLFFSEDN